MGRYYIGLDIGGTKCAAVLGKVDDNISIEDKIYFLTEKQTPDAILSRFDEFIEKKKYECEIKGIGISCGGPLDSENGVIMKPPSLPLWDNIEIVKHFENKFKIKTYLQNDANACAVAEWKFGAGAGSKNMVFLTFGTGFGAGLILGGKLYSGTNDNAGEIGHVRLTERGPVGYGKAGSCEGYCSGSGMARLAKIMSENKKYQSSYREYLSSIGDETEISAKTLAENARKGNEFCLAVYKKSGKMLGRSLAVLVDVLNPERIVIGGIFMRASDLLLPPCEKVLKKESLCYAYEKVQILPAGLGESIGDFAAVAVATGEYL